MMCGTMPCGTNKKPRSKAQTAGLIVVVFTIVLVFTPYCIASSGKERFLMYRKKRREARRRSNCPGSGDLAQDQEIGLEQGEGQPVLGRVVTDLKDGIREQVYEIET